VASTNRAPAPLDQPSIISILNSVSGQLTVRGQGVLNGRMYQGAHQHGRRQDVDLLGSVQRRTADGAVANDARHNLYRGVMRAGRQHRAECVEQSRLHHGNVRIGSQELADGRWTSSLTRPLATLSHPMGEGRGEGKIISSPLPYSDGRSGCSGWPAVVLEESHCLLATRNRSGRRIEIPARCAWSG